MSSRWSVPCFSRCCIACAPAVTAPASAGKRTTSSRAPMTWSCTNCTAPWGGWVSRWRQANRTAARWRRCTKDVIEEQLFARRRDLFSQLDIVFFDTTSLYFEGEGGADPRRARPQQGPSSRLAPDGGRGGARWRRAAAVLRDVAGQHRRRDHLAAGGRSPATALRHWRGLRRRRPRHDLRGNRGRPGGRRPAVHFGGARAPTKRSARRGAGRSPRFRVVYGPANRAPIRGR